MAKPVDAPSSADRPPFARHYPRDAELDALVDAFDAGNYALVHEEAPRLARRTQDPLVARAARDLRSRIEPDPLALRMLAGSAALLAFLVAWFYLHRHLGRLARGMRRALAGVYFSRISSTSARNMALIAAAFTTSASRGFGRGVRVLPDVGGGFVS